MIEILERRTVLSALDVGPNIDATKLTGNESEPAIAVVPGDPSRMFALSNTELNGLASSKSSDGGASWHAKTIADGLDNLPLACCDPAAAFDGFGNLFISYLETRAKTVVIALSIDGGDSFRVIHQFTGPVDQPTITTGPGTVWVTFAKGPTVVASGANVGGVNSVGAFSLPQAVPASSGGNFGDIAIGPAGQVAVAFQKPLSTPHNSRLWVSVDPDGLGPAKFSRAVPFSKTRVGGFLDIPSNGSRRSIDSEVGLGFDRSGGEFNGRLYAVYTDQVEGVASNTDIFLRYSDTNGARWSCPVLLNDDTTQTSQILPRIAIDQTTGHVGVSWMDSRHDTSTDKSGDTDSVVNDDAENFATVVTSLPDGVGVAPNVQVSAKASNADAAGSEVGFGDYGGLAFSNAKLVSIWADNSNRTGNNPDGTLHAFDLYVATVTDNIVSPLPMAAFAPCSAGPTVKLLTKRAVHKGSDYKFQVAYIDDLAIDPTSIASGNLSVTGPNGYVQSAELVKISNAVNPARVSVMYRITSPTEAWTVADNGSYTISVGLDQVADTESQFVLAGPVGVFAVNVKG